MCEVAKINHNLAMTNKHLNQTQRVIISRLHERGLKQSQIAEIIDVSQSTISRELNRNKGLSSYNPEEAEALARKRKFLKAPRKPKISGQLEKRIIRFIRYEHSPRQISGYLKRKNGSYVCKETIYRYIRADRASGGELYKHLRFQGRTFKSKPSGKDYKGKIPNRVSIVERPESVNKRYSYGHWEADLIEGKKGTGFILSLYERKSRIAKIAFLPQKQSLKTANLIIKTLRKCKVKSITYDNGNEFAAHELVNKKLGSRSYFCNPYHSWEKGGVENFNGLVRQYLPKGSDFSILSQQEIKCIEHRINHRPRKILNFRSPAELQKKIAA